MAYQKSSCTSKSSRKHCPAMLWSESLRGLPTKSVLGLSHKESNTWWPTRITVDKQNLLFCFTDEADYTCTTDLDGDGDGTKWYKKAWVGKHDLKRFAKDKASNSSFCAVWAKLLPWHVWFQHAFQSCKVDTNAHKYQGQTDQECCLPKRPNCKTAEPGRLDSNKFSEGRWKLQIGCLRIG